ncbi:MAG: SapB/AmfS family lanthipeptide [Propionibacteriaceae bacterium]|nr:SapB/AmfS family lanthipeptide [Propionibacteriaceae bacterium]
MSDALDLQATTQPEVPDEEKGSNNSYFLCHNSGTSNFLCWRP